MKVLKRLKEEKGKYEIIQRLLVTQLQGEKKVEKKAQK